MFRLGFHGDTSAKTCCILLLNLVSGERKPGVSSIVSAKNGLALAFMTACAVQASEIVRREPDGEVTAADGLSLSGSSYAPGSEFVLEAA